MENRSVLSLDKIDSKKGIIITENGTSTKETRWPMEQSKIPSIFLKLRAVGDLVILGLPGVRFSVQKNKIYDHGYNKNNIIRHAS